MPETSLQRIQALKVERRTVHEGVQQLLQKAHQDNKRTLTAEERAEVDKRLDDIETRLDPEIATLERALAIEDRLAESRGLISQGTDGGTGSPHLSRDPGERREQERVAFGAMCQARGNAELLTAEHRAIIAPQPIAEMPQDVRSLVAGVGASGGFTVPTTVATTILEGQAAYAAPLAWMYQYPTQSGEDANIPTVGPADFGEQVGEEGPLTEGGETFAVATLKGFWFSSKVIKVSWTLLADSPSVTSQFIEARGSKRLGKIKSLRLATGNGTTQPQGVVTAATVGKTAASPTAYNWEDLQDLIHSVDPDYALSQKAGFALNWTELGKLKRDKDSQGRPLWLPGIAVREPDTLLGMRYVVWQSLANAAASTKPVVFGDWSAFVHRPIGQMVSIVLKELYATNLSTGFVLLERWDSRLIDAGAGALKVLQMAAS